MRRAKYPRQFTHSLTDDQYLQLKEISDSREISMSEVSREIFSEYLKSHKSKNIDDNKNETSDDRIFDMLSEETEKKKDEELDF